MLNAAIEGAQLDKTLLSKASFQPFPTYGQRERWAALAPEVKAYFAGLAQELEGCAWPELPAKLYMDFIRNGDRSRYETPYFVRRRQLFGLLMAECIEGRGRLVDDIINGVWAICEESTWIVPAHNNNPRNDPAWQTTNKLVDLSKTLPDIDLFAAETGSLLAWVVSLMGERLDQESPMIVQRVAQEIDARVLTPFLERTDLWWMGIDFKRDVNNWNPWINSNILAAVLVMEPDPDRRMALVKKVGVSSQRFLDGYAPDGGCDEGPGYFNVAGASLLDVLMLMEDGTNGAVTIYDEPLIQNMGKYIMHTHIADTWHVNFADAPAQVRPDAMLLWRAGEKTGQPDLVAYAKSALARGFAALPYEAAQYTVYRRLCNIFAFDASAYQGAPPVESPGHYFPGIQVMTARQAANSTEGLFLAAKGGTNGESHNHNDVGNYIISLDGEPMLLDVGVGVYTKFTFNEMRYTIWSMQSGYHNTAIVNGCDQRPGTTYAARETSYAQTAQGVHFELDMAGAYGPEAALESYGRSIDFDRAHGRITVSDTVKMAQAGKPLSLPLMFRIEPVLEPGLLRLKGTRQTLCVRYDASLFDARLEVMPLEDEKLLRNWECEKVYRVMLTRKAAVMHDAFTLSFEAEA